MSIRIIHRKLCGRNFCSKKDGLCSDISLDLSSTRPYRYVVGSAEDRKRAIDAFNKGKEKKKGRKQCRQTVRGTLWQRQRSMRHIFSPENLLSTALLGSEEGTMECVVKRNDEQ